MRQEQDIKSLLKKEFKEQLVEKCFKRSLVSIVSDTLYSRPFHEIVLEAYQEVLEEFKKELQHE